MNWYEIVLGVVLIAVSVLIVVFTLAQEQKGQGLSGAIMGESSATMAAGRRRFLCRHAGCLRFERAPVILAG